MKIWIQENKKLAVILGVIIVGVLGLGTWAYLAYDSYSTVRAEYDRIGADVTRLESEKLYPNEENVAKKTEKVKNYEEQVGKLRDVLLLNQQAVKSITETDFQARLKERANDLSLRAKRAGTVLPDNFALGFDEYIASLPRSPEVASELNLHLDAMEKLVGTIVEAGAFKLESLERTKLNSEKGNAAAPPPPVAPVKPKPGAKGAKGASAAPVVLQAEPVLDRYPIKVAFKCDQAHLQHVLNTIANPNPKVMPFFMVVRAMRIDNDKQDAPTKDDIKEKMRNGGTAGQEAAAPPPAAGGPKAITAPAPLPPDAVAIMGDEMLRVSMEVDFIRFREAPKTDDSKAAQPKK